MTEFQDGNFIVMEVIGCQVHAIGKAIRPLFADLVTLCMKKLCLKPKKPKLICEKFVSNCLLPYLYHKNSSDCKATH